MSGHSKWATTKHKKAAVDAKRAKLFAKLIKNIEVAARTGGGDVSGNPTLFDAIQKAKKSSVPNDNIDRAVKRGSGEDGGGVDYQTIMYEGYAPGGVALLIECLTDNRNRAASDVRVAVTRGGGSMGDPGSVSYLFTRKGVVEVPKTDGLTDDDVLGAVLDAGADEVNDEGDTFEVISEATDLVDVRTALVDSGIDYDAAEARFVPATQIELDADGARKVFRLIDSLEDSDDVQNVYSNADVSDDVLAELEDDDSMRVLGVDPGLTRCGLGVIDSLPSRRAEMVAVGVERTASSDSVDVRLGDLANALDRWLDEHRPDVVSVERVFARHDVSTIMGTAQASGLAIGLAARRGIPVAMHTPSEVKASITGNGRADKKQVTAMVTRILHLDTPPKPADAADALALAICHLWRGAGAGTSTTGPADFADRTARGRHGTGLTAAQRAWADALKGKRG